MLHVALLRNVNVGQPGHPSTAQILAAFAEAGAHDAVTFQSNGTLVFSAPAVRAEALAQDAVVALARATGLEREVFTRPLEFLRPIVEQHGSAADARLRELTLHDGPAVRTDDPLVLDVSRRARCTLLEAGSGWAVILNHRPEQGNATPVVERVTGGAASSRGLPTMVRLLERFSEPATR